MEKLKRYIIFFIGLYINSLGVALITKASLGTSPISSIPYVLSLNFPFTLGNFTIFFSLFLIFLQLLILRKNFKIEHFLQIPISILFGYFIDWSMILLGFVNPHFYLTKMIYLLIGCLILGFGVYTEVLANVVMLPGESFVRAIVMTWHTEFGVTKICFDVSMTVIAAILSFVFAGKLDGVREGTVISALLVGFIARLFGRFLSFVEPMLFSKTQDMADSEASEDSADIPTVIAIAREYGSGGHDLGEALAKRLGFDFYDNEIIQMADRSMGAVNQCSHVRELISQHIPGCFSRLLQTIQHIHNRVHLGEIFSNICGHGAIFTQLLHEFHTTCGIHDLSRQLRKHIFYTGYISRYSHNYLIQSKQNRHLDQQLYTASCW